MGVLPYMERGSYGPGGGIIQDYPGGPMSPQGPCEREAGGQRWDDRRPRVPPHPGPRVTQGTSNLWTPPWSSMVVKGTSPAASQDEDQTLCSHCHCHSASRAAGALTGPDPGANAHSEELDSGAPSGHVTGVRGDTAHPLTSLSQQAGRPHPGHQGQGRQPALLRCVDEPQGLAVQRATGWSRQPHDAWLHLQDILKMPQRGGGQSWKPASGQQGSAMGSQ